MKVYVDELPKDCAKCPCESDRWCNLMGYVVDGDEYNDKRPKQCPLQSLAEHDKQVRKEVLADIEKRIINYFRRQDKKPFQKSIEQMKVDLLTSINQLKGE